MGKRSPWMIWSGVLGFALGGFFDGILLHQILQWHHLLSLVPQVTNLRMQVLWDGYFHALMYVIAALGLWGLWRAHRSAELVRARSVFGALLVGFGLWHIIDAVLSHWLLGIHRIRVDVDNPLFWDLLWFFAFGVVPLIIGIWLGRGGGRSGRKSSISAMLGLTIAVVGAGGWGMLPPQDQPFTTVVFRPDVEPAGVMAALAAVDGRLVWSDGAMGVVVATLDEARRWDLYRHGALLVSGAGVPAACFNWSQA